MLTIDEVLTRGVSEIYSTKKGLSDLMKKKKITLYQGFDPTMPALHLGNFAGMLKLRQFQKLGHKVIFLVGDFTGMIGDPTDKAEVRKQLTREEVTKNAKDFKNFASHIIDFDGPNKAEILYNSTWNDELTFLELIEITSKFTVQQMIERDMFQERIKNNKPIYLHEFLYPIAQAYDSLYMKVDLEVGGNDQTFNMLVGRTLVKAVDGREKFVLTTKLLVDKEGHKVGKTTGNALFLDSTPEAFYGGIMSFPDEVIPLAFELLTELPIDNIDRKNPLGEKKRLAYELTKMLWGESKAEKAATSFGTSDTAKIIKIKSSSLPLLDLVFATKQVTSRSEVKRLIAQKAIEVDNQVKTNPTEEINIPKSGMILKIGKIKFVKIICC